MTIVLRHPAIDRRPRRSPALAHLAV